MRKDEIWAVSLEKIESFFRQQPDVADAGQELRYEGCRILLTALPLKGEGFWQTPQTQIVMDGPEQDVTAIYRRFFLQFLSAGG